MHRTLLSVLITIFFAGILNSQIDEKDLQLNKLINIALTHNPEINAQQDIVTAKANAILPAGSLPDPMVTGGYFLSPVVTKEGPQEWKVGLTQHFPWPGKLSGNEKIARLNLQKEQEQLRLVTLSVIRDVRTIYESMRLLASEEAITRENLEILTQLESVVRFKYTTSTASQAYLLKIQMELLKLEDDLTSIGEQHSVLVEKLTRALGTIYSDSLIFDDLLRFENELIPTDSSGFENNPKLKLADLTVDVNREKYHLSELSSYPDFAAGIDYINLKGGSGDNPMMVRGGISLPLRFGKNKAQREFASSMLSGAKHMQDNVRLSLSSGFEKIRFDMDDSKRKYLLYTKDLLPLSKQNYTVAKSAYLSDEIDFETYLNAENNLLNIKLMCARLRARYYTARANYLNISAQEF
ncbi:MAG: TolC family protein [Fidelibacterota bacterium]